MQDYDPRMADIFSLGIVFGEIIMCEEGESFRLGFTIEKNDLSFGVDTSLIENILKPYKPPNGLIQLIQVNFFFFIFYFYFFIFFYLYFSFFYFIFYFIFKIYLFYLFFKIYFFSIFLFLNIF